MSQVFKKRIKQWNYWRLAFPAMSLLLIGNTVWEHEDVMRTTESAAVCLRVSVAEAQFYVPRSYT